MRICVVVSNMLDFGGLEEFAKNLAIGVQKQGHQVSVLSTVWIPPDNQYWRSLRENQVTTVQLPRWLSLIVADWNTKEKILAAVLWLATPLTVLMGLALSLLRRQPAGKSISSARSWLQGKLMSRVIGPDRRQPFVRLLLNWWRLRWRPDVLHIHGYTSTLLFVIDWAYSKKLPVIYEEHQTPDAQFDWWLDFKTSINKATIVVGVSEKSAQALREVCGVTQPIEVAYYMVPDPHTWGWTEEAGRDAKGGPIRVTTNARLYVTKGLTYLLDAITQIRAIHPAVEFKVYGGGELRQELLAYADRLGLDGNQIFVGAFTSRQELDRIMAQTDIYVMSSILEGLPVALLEAMSYGRAVVVTTVGGIPEVIEEGANGLLCEPRDVPCLAQKIVSLIEDPDRRRRLGQAARQTYEQGPFSPAAVSRQYVSIYQKALSAHLQ